MKQLRSIEGVVRGLGVDGDGAVLLPDGSIVLARGVLPGERVRIGEIDRGRVRRARRVEVLEPSAERVAPPCPYAAACGGCPLMHASARLADETKRDRVRRALAPIAPDVEIEIEAPTLRLGYRQRARLAFVRDESGVRIGYRGDASRHVFDVERCLVLAPVLDETLRVLRERLAAHLVGSGEIRLGTRGHLGMVRIETRDAQPSALYSVLDALVSERSIAGAALLAGGASAPAWFGERHEETSDAQGRILRAPLGGFAQAHGEHNVALAARVIDDVSCEGARVLELFAGHGNFTLSLAERAASVVAVELDEEASRCLAENLAAHHLGARVVTADAARATASLSPRSIDVALLDPPREGARDVIAPLVALAPARVVYVSCNPESLARDAAMLIASGYRLARARAFDMFPQTAHVEVVACFERVSSAGKVARPTRRR